MTKPMKGTTIVAIGVALAAFGLNAASVHADATTSALYVPPDVASVRIARGASQSWTWTVPRGTYLVTARIDYTLTALGPASNDSRLQCQLVTPDGATTSVGDMFNASAYSKPMSMQQTFSDAVDDGAVTLVAPMSAGWDFHVTLTCFNVSVSTTATPLALRRIKLAFAPSSSIAALPSASVRTTAPPPSPTPYTPPAPVPLPHKKP